jgi:hypothetical protein
MSKKRRTKQQKIIANLRRQLEHTPTFQPLTPTLEPEEKIVYETPREQIIIKKVRPETTIAFSYDPKLIKKDLIKTAALSTIFLGAIFLIQRLFHL